MAKKAARRPAPKPAAHVGPAAVAQRQAPRQALEQIKVRATSDGYYEDVYRRAGDVFLIPATLNAKTGLPRLFSQKWMEFVDAATPDRLMSLGNAALREESKRVLGEKVAQKAASGAMATGVDNPDDGLNPLGAD